MATQAIRLPEERAEQARQIAALQNTTIADLVGRLISDEAKRVGVGLGNIDVANLEDGTIHCDYGAGVHIWTREQTLDVADAIEKALAKRGSMLDIDASIEVVRVGMSVRLRHFQTGYEGTFAPSVAHDLVALLRRHAN